MSNVFKFGLIGLIIINTILISINLVFMLINLYRIQSDLPIPPKTLFLTPLLDIGNYQEAQRLSKVQDSVFLNVKSYSGYLTVDPDTDSHMFFWYFTASRRPTTAPLLLCLMGDAVTSSLASVFQEMGPFKLTSPDDLNHRNYSWHRELNLLFLDNPVGTGFSLSNRFVDYNQELIGSDLLNVMQQFFQLFPDLRNRQFFVCGESYGAKNAVALAYAIHKNNERNERKIKLQGILIGSGFYDPVNQMNFADYLFQIGLVDQKQKSTLHPLQNDCSALIRQEKYADAFRIYSDLIWEAPDVTPHGSLISYITGFTYFRNYLYANADELGESDDLNLFLNSPKVRNALHVGRKNFFMSSAEVTKHLYVDLMRSVAPWITELLLHYRVLIYSGQVDMGNPYPLTKNFLNNLNFSSSQEYTQAARYKWLVENELAGYWKRAGNLTEVLVRNAGHRVSRDQPKWMYELANKFIKNIPLT